ncbi:putative nuclease HARBI1 [Operophtera brumata]|uniref:Putative nuclease HARBI1 n=1 Tax=Operophtera brumata TaxID=104452 RepID=A0A0L7L728_OPEBR|nr:putative nuclease HARBI1 [Operophtera brumata]
MPYDTVYTNQTTMDDDDVIAVLGLALVLQNRKRKRDRTEWSKRWLLKRKQFSHVNLINELRFSPTDYENYLRMDEKLYLKLLSLITPLIQRQDTVMRKAISAHERLAVTLRFLATGRTYECLKYSAIISPQALGRIIPETCDAIYEVLKEDYLQVSKQLKPNSNHYTSLIVVCQILVVVLVRAEIVVQEK